LAFTVMIFLLAGCNGEVEDSVARLEEQLKTVETPEEEQDILDNLWSISYNSEGTDPSEKVGMRVSATDAEGNEVINDLSEAVEPVYVTITLHASTWSKKIEFVPLDIENVYLLLRE